LPEVSRTDRANEVNKGFIIWLCWIAVCSDFDLCRKKQKTFSLLKPLSAVYAGGALAELLITTKQLIKILKRKKLIFKNIMFFTFS
jgi:hypothetical protein